MRTGIIGLLALSALAIACASKRKESFQEIARDANAYLPTMKAAAAAVLGTPKADPAAVVSACTSVDGELWSLRKVRIEYEHLGLRRDADVDLPRHADYLLLGRCAYCGGQYRDPDSMRPGRLEMCAGFCRDSWSRLVDAVERLRVAAREHDVEIVSLRP
jgi:hypothetical protein